MATKTISVKLEAYEKLRTARQRPDESFSQVILRAEWPGKITRAGEYLAARREQGPIFSVAALADVEQLDRNDRPPEDKWKRV